MYLCDRVSILRLYAIYYFSDVVLLRTVWYLLLFRRCTFSDSMVFIIFQTLYLFGQYGIYCFSDVVPLRTVWYLMFFRRCTCPFVHYYNKFLSPTSILECNSHKIKIHVLNILNFFSSGLTIWISIPYLAI